MNMGKNFSIRGYAAILAALAVLGLALLVQAQAPPVTVEKSVSPTEAYPGDIVTYTSVFSNTTASEQTIDLITDTLPAGLTYLAPASECDIGTPDDPDSQPLVWTGPFTVPASGTRTLAYYALVPDDSPTGHWDNVVQAHLGTGETVSGTATLTILGPELTGAKAAVDTEVPIGQPAEYRVVLNSTGTLTATVSAITDTLPPSFTFDQMQFGLPDPTIQGNMLIWPGPFEIAPDATLEFGYRITTGGTVEQKYENSLVAAYDGVQTPVYTAAVTLTYYTCYLPLSTRNDQEEPPPTPTPPPPPVDLRLAYDSYTGGSFEIMAVDADGTNLVNVSNEAGGDLDPDWSPDGTRIAWVHFYENNAEILAANADGTGKVNLTNNASGDRGPAWSPDGSKIAFHSLRVDDKWQIFVMDPNGANVTRLTYHLCQSHDPVWSPDGSKIAYVCGLDEYANLYVMDADGQNYMELTDDREFPDEAQAWSPDGTKIAYVRYDGRARKDSEIWVVDLVTGAHTQITHNDYADYAPDWSPDGAKIAFSTYVDATYGYEIALMNPDGSGLVNITQTAKVDNKPQWSPDGTLISFVTNRDGNVELYVMNADGSGQLRLTDTADNEDSHDWMPLPE
jgi:uncharacterized repeat protein (TIGR01451 family)